MTRLGARPNQPGPRVEEDKGHLVCDRSNSRQLNKRAQAQLSLLAAQND